MTEEEFTTPTTERYKELVKKHDRQREKMDPEQAKKEMQEHGFEVEIDSEGESGPSQ